jgi:hypothetical protein
MCCGLAFAQQSRIEVGLQVTGVHLHKLHETPYGFGGRALFGLTSAISLDMEVVRFPETSSTSTLFGLKSGRHLKQFGLFGKGRGGLMDFGGAFRKQFFMADIGGVLEYYPSPSTTIRIDLGDSILFYGSYVIPRGPQSRPLGTVHNFQPALGFGLRF